MASDLNQHVADDVFDLVVGGALSHWATVTNTVARNEDTGVPFSADIADNEDSGAPYVLNFDVVFNGIVEAYIDDASFTEGETAELFKAAKVLRHTSDQDTYDSLSLTADLADAVVQYGLFGTRQYLP